jgi:carbon-monoxide dehydrogenase medium subunit
MPRLEGFHRPQSLQEAVALLAQDPEAKLLSGGATLVAMMNARVLEPAALISLGGVPEIQGIAEAADGTLRIGAFTRHCETAADARLRDDLFVVRDAASQIANATVRNMGTIGGAVAFADPGLDYPPALVATGAQVELVSVQGTRRLAAADFFVDWYTTALEPGELVSAILLPKARPGRSRYCKLARVSGDYAIASVAIVLTSSGAVRVAVGACGPKPLHSPEVDAMLSRDRSEAGVEHAARKLVGLADPVDDVRGSADYRRMLIPRLLRQALTEVEHAE